MPPERALAISSSSVLARVILGVMLINLFVVVLAGLSMRQSHMQFQQEAEITTRNLAHVLENELAGAIKTNDIALFNIMDEYQGMRALGHFDDAEFNALIEKIRSRLPHVDALRITDSQGKLIYGTGVEPGANVSLADRAHFIRLRGDGNAGLVFSLPQTSRINHKKVIVLARGIWGADASFEGMVFAAIPLEHFSRSFSGLDVGPHGNITLRDDELGVIARLPALPESHDESPRKSAPGPLLELLRSGKDSGTYSAVSNEDNIQRTYSYRKIAGTPLLISVGLAGDDYLAQWRELSLRLAALVVLFALISLAAAWMIYRYWQRQVRSVGILAGQEARFRTVADFTYDWEYWQGPDQEILYMTPSCERVTGYSQAEFTADPGLLLSIIFPEDSHLMEQHLRDIHYHDGSLLNFRIVRRDGEIRWIDHHCRAVTGIGGEPSGRRVSNRDVTERKHAEDELRTREAMFKAMTDTSPLAIYMSADAELRGIYMNPTFVKLFGYTLDEVPSVAQWWPLAYPDQDYRKQLEAEWQRRVMHAIETRSAIEPMETVVTCKDGSRKYISWGFTSIGDQNWSFGLDLTERKEAESALMRSNADLEQFAYSISHDMRQPLRMVTGHLQLLQRSLTGTLTPDDSENLNFALDGARRMDAMIVSLLDYSRVGRKTDSKKWMAGRDSLDEALAFLAPVIKESGAEVEVDGEWPKVLASRDELTRLFQNLIGNAVKYCAPGQTPRIEVSSSVTPQLWRVSVRDHGIGIDPQQAVRLFQFFSRLQSRAHYEGTGMGLALCRRIVEHHDGRIWVESAGDGQGSIFIFELPLNPEPAQGEPHEIH